MTSRRAFMKVLVGGIAGLSVPLALAEAPPLPPPKEGAPPAPTRDVPPLSASGYRLAIFDPTWEREWFVAALPAIALRLVPGAIEMGDYVEFRDVAQACEVGGCELRTATGELICRSRFTGGCIKILPGDTLHVKIRFDLDWQERSV